MPKITIDFGNGKKMTRTVNGNVATYVCTTEGAVIDVLPGIYNKKDYLRELASIRKQFDDLPSDRTALSESLQELHTRLAAEPQTVEPATRGDTTVDSDAPLMVRALHGASMIQNELIADTGFNQSKRRPMIHKYLSQNALTTPETMKRWLYREVLHSDLDDPYLGFDRILSQHYPFDDSGT